MHSVDYKYAPRHFQYRHEPQSFRSLSVTTKALGEYFRKLVDVDGGWLELRDLAPADAVRRSSAGHLSRSDFRYLKRAVAELIDAGYLVLGELDAEGWFLPLGAGQYLAIRDWVPSQQGMTRQQTAEYYAAQEARAARHLADMHEATREYRADELEEPDTSRTESVTASMADPVAQVQLRSEPPQAPAAARSRIVATVKPQPERLKTHRKWIDRSPSAGNSKGTELALFHTIPFRNPPLSPKGESAGADERDSFLDSDSPPTPSATLAMQAIEWLNQQRSTPTRFRADSQTVRRLAQRWRKTGRDWPLLRKALDLRLAALKAAKPERWEDWATPATLFNRKLERFVEEAQAGHEYRPLPATATPSATTETRSPGPPSSRHHRAMAQAHEERKKGAERAFADVLTIADMVGADGDWTSKLRHSTARAVVRDLGWSRIVEQREAIRDQFLARYLGGPRHELAYAAA